MPTIEASIGLLRIGGQHRGTAWVVAPSIAVTAYHCVDGVVGQIVVTFGDKEYVVTVLDFAKEIDIALLAISDATHPLPLEVIARPFTDLVSDWFAHGYPRLIDGANDGVRLTGTISRMRSSWLNEDALQLLCNEANNYPNFDQAVFGGVSGAPVFVRSGRDYVVGVIIEAPTASGERIMFARPIESIRNRFKDHLGALSTSSWNKLIRYGTISWAQNAFGVSNIDQEFINSIWDQDLKGFWCDVHCDESPELVNAVARLLMHSKAGAGTQLSFSAPDAWRRSLIEAERNWVPIVSFASPADQYQWCNVTSPVPQDGYSIGDKTNLAREIHQSCDRWVLKRLRDRLSSFFVSNLSAGYPIAVDVRRAMEQLWREWRQRLEENLVLLHHFLTLMVTKDGNYDCATASVGAGPLTFDKCIFEPVVFALAICSCLPPSMQSPKFPHPGNLGDAQMAGHSCGIQLLDGQLLQLALRSHRWATPIVLLAHFQKSWKAHQAEYASLRQKSGPDASLLREPPRHVLFSADAALLDAMFVGRDELTHHLTGMLKELSAEQESYKIQAEAIP